MAEPGPMCRWKAKGSIDSVLGMAEIGGVHTLAQVKKMLGLHLTDMEVRYPGSRADINLTRRSLDRTDGYAWHQTVELWTGATCRTLTLSIEQAGGDVAVTPAPAVPRKRADDALRERYREHLSAAFQGGSLDLAEFTRRNDAVHDVVHVDELPPLIEDLDPLPSPEAEVVPAAGGRGRLPDSRRSSLAAGACCFIIAGISFSTASEIFSGDTAAVLRVIAALVLFVAMAVALAAVGSGRRS